jgi:hypothetical protein
MPVEDKGEMQLMMDYQMTHNFKRARSLDPVTNHAAADQFKSGDLHFELIALSPAVWAIRQRRHFLFDWAG